MRTDDLTRFTYFERIVHWVVGLTFLFVLLTGLAFSYPSLFWLTTLVGGGPAARVLHPWMGALLTVALVIMFFTWLKDMGIRKADVEWMRAIKHYTLHRKDQVPATGKYNAGQKVFFWAMTLLVLAHLVSGIPMWFPAGYSAGTLATMRLVHFLVTPPAALFLIAHIYLASFAFPGTARGMLYGKVSRAWARLHHPLWHEQETKS